jgi:hypothetical protein
MVADPRDKHPVARPQGPNPVDAFLKVARDVATPEARGTRARLIFALDATMSRQPTWDLAQSLQGRMFQAAASLGGLDVQLVYFRGFGECRASRFVSGGEGLAGLMARIDCRGGTTQIGKVLRHAVDEAKRARLGALIYVGDAIEEPLDALCGTAGELGLLGVKIFAFHEGSDAQTSAAFREIARLTGGAYAAFDAGAPDRLAALLAAAAAYAAGGHRGLEAAALGDNAAARFLLSQMRR